MGNINTTTAFESITDTVSNTALSLIDFGFTAQDLIDASRLFVAVGTNSIRVDWSGNVPTASDGLLLDGSTVNYSIEVIGNENINQFQMIRATGSDSSVFVLLEG